MNSSSTQHVDQLRDGALAERRAAQRNRRQVRLGERLGIAELTQHVGLGQAVRGPLGDVAAQFEGDLLPGAAWRGAGSRARD